MKHLFLLPCLVLLSCTTTMTTLPDGTTTTIRAQDYKAIRAVVLPVAQAAATAATAAAIEALRNQSK